VFSISQCVKWQVSKQLRNLSLLHNALHRMVQVFVGHVVSVVPVPELKNNWTMWSSILCLGGDV
jgi:hypothetical protein